MGCISFLRRAAGCQGPARSSRADDVLSEKPEDDEIIVPWLNSTSSLLLWSSFSEHTHGPSHAIERNKVVQLPALDPSMISGAARHRQLSAGTN